VRGVVISGISQHFLMSKRKPAIRTAMGSPDDVRSCVWRLWVQGDEVYFGATLLLKAVKVSLHKTGIWRIAMTDSWDRPDKTTDRVLAKWRRPPEYAPGLTGAVIVYFYPELPMRRRRTYQIDDSAITWLPLPQYGNVLTLSVIIANGDADLGSNRFPVDTKPVGQLKKTNGEIACLIASEIKLTDAMSKRMEEEKGKLAFKHRLEYAGKSFPIRDLVFIGPSEPTAVHSIYDLPGD
jgi:hypothetical protein